jgi:plastocyanin
MFGTDQSGNPITIDWKVAINAPPGQYDFLCFFHPGMQGTVKVVAANQSVTSQAQNDDRGNVQFLKDRAGGKGAEAAAKTPKFSGGQPGTRTYDVNVGVTAADNHLAVLEMLPQTLNLVDGDKVSYHWPSQNEVHSVGFPADSPLLPFPFGFDCGATFQNPTGPPCIDPADGRPEGILDPGTTPSGSALTSPTALVDSGVLVGTGYNLSPTAQQWSVTTNSSTAAGTYAFQCTVHDVMHGQLIVSKSR